MSYFKNKTILVTGGTGSFGREFVKYLLTKNVAKIVVFSRDEMKQWEMKNDLAEIGADLPVEFQLGDVRDFERLHDVCRGVELVVHAAATKIVPSAEWNPYECIKTNILGANNLIEAATRQNVQRVVALSTDKASDPVNLYGATKLASDKLFVASNFSRQVATSFSIVRYGNVLGSRGSVIPFFKKRAVTGVIPITDPRMTRFIITLKQAVELVEKCFQGMIGGEIFVKKCPSVTIGSIAEAVAPECSHSIIGMRPGEKLHEQMIGVHDARATFEFDDHFRIYSPFCRSRSLGKPVPSNFVYESSTNDWWLSATELKNLIAAELNLD